MKKLFFLIIPLFLFVSCRDLSDEKMEFCPKEQYDSLLSGGILRVTLNYNSIDYYVFKGKPLGFQLEILNHLASYLGLQLQVQVRDNYAQDFESLIRGESDFIAGNVKETSLRSRFLLFSQPHSYSPLVLIQRASKSDTVISSWNEIDGKTITLPAHSSFSEYLFQSSFQNQADVKIVFDSESSIENLIEMVSNKTIDYTVCELNVAKVYASYYDNIDCSFIVSDTLPLAWVFHPRNEVLRDSINLWLQDFKDSQEYKRIYRKYYHVSYSPVRFSNTMEFRKERKLSKYDKTLKKISRKYNWDWRLYGAIIYQESKFIDGLVGEGGSFGLLQLMPSTASKFGISPNMSGDEQITNGAKLIDYLRKKYREAEADSDQHWKFVIAAFHTGSGHVDDARRIAPKFGKDPNVWDSNVDSCMILKSKPSVYNMPEVKSGYHYGKRSVKYVNDVWSRYLHYKNIYSNQ